MEQTNTKKKVFAAASMVLATTLAAGAMTAPDAEAYGSYYRGGYVYNNNYAWQPKRHRISRYEMRLREEARRQIEREILLRDRYYYDNCNPCSPIINPCTPMCR